jgi:mitochondrial splicing suppressor protein 51
MYGMEATFTCLRCVRAISRQSSRSSSSKIRIATAGARKLSSNSNPPISKSSLSPPNNNNKKQRRSLPRHASTAAAVAETPADSARRATVYPPEYGEYRPSIRLSKNNLFHPFSSSPVPEIRERALFTKNHAYCPHPSHQRTREPASPDDPEARKNPASDASPPALVKFDCPDCGIATYCCEEHWVDDYENHIELCATLQQINEDDHDLRSGRYFSEFEYPGPQIEEIMVNMTNWDTFLYTRQFEAVNDDRHLRQVTRLLTYPLTAGSILHELSPYNIRSGGRMTVEGLKSLSGE